MIIVFSSIKGGTGKSTLAFHLSIAAMLDNYEVETFDLDFPQYSFTQYYKNRTYNKNLEIWKNHICLKSYEEIDQINNDDKKIIIIDTAGRYDKNLINLHKKANIIITPINDSFIDINTIMLTEKERWGNLGSYYELIYDSKNFNKNLKWIVARNRTSTIASNHKQLIENKLKDLSNRLNFEISTGLKERMIFRELFLKGETILDIKTKLSISHVAAKFEIRSLWKDIKSLF